MIDPAPSIFVFCALACEAKPLIDTWKLKKLAQPAMPFSLYRNATRVVVISGIGKVAMAGAVAFTLASFKLERLPILLNLGIAGHYHADLGTLFLAHKIIDSETARPFFPQLPFAVPCATHSIKTYSKPCTDYETDALFEMEAAGFYEMAVKFSSRELIQVVKIISDNVESSLASINEATVYAAINTHLSILETLIEQLIGLQRSASIDAITRDSHSFSKQYHLSVSNGLKLTALLQRWLLLKGNIFDYTQAPSGTAKELIRWLEVELEKTDFYL